MNKLEKKIEKYDQYFAWIVILIVALWLMGTNYFAWTVFLFGVIVLVIIYVFNKGRKNNVNLKSDITPLALLVLLALIIVVFIPASPATVLLIMFLMGLAILLYK